MFIFFFFFSSRRRHTRFSRDWSSDVCSSDLSRRSPLLSKCGQSRASAGRLECPPSGAAPVARCAPSSAYLRPDRSTSSFASPLATRSLRVLRRTCSSLLYLSHLYNCHPERDIFCLVKDLSLLRPHVLPRRLRNSGDLAAQRQPAEAQAAHAELAQVSARTPAQLAAVVPTRGEFRPLLFLVARQLKLLFDLRVFNSFCCSHAFLRESVSQT